MPNRPTADRVRVAPKRNPQFAHLSLEGLRNYRHTLASEEGRVSYWRRIIQARLDLIQAADSGVLSNVDTMREVFAHERFGTGRTALLGIMPHDDIPPLPDLLELWSQVPEPGDRARNSRLTRELSVAESQLSTYRKALHRRLADATDELIARYREEPSRCLSALPETGPRRTAVG